MRDINKSALSEATAKLSDDGALSGLQHNTQHAPKKEAIIRMTRGDATLAWANLELTPIANGD